MDNINQSKTNDISEPINLNETTAVPVANIDKEKIVDKIELDEKYSFSNEEIKLLQRELELLKDKVKFYSNRCKYLEQELVKKDIELETTTRAYHKIRAEYTFMQDLLPNNSKNNF